MNTSQMTLEKAGFHYRFVPAQEGSTTTLLLLHGTGGSETDLLPLGHQVAPQAALLSPRGQVQEGTLTRYFRRLAPGVLDEADIVHRAAELDSFLRNAVTQHALEPERLTALGYSNGANMAASLLLLHPQRLGAAILLRPMLPLEPSNLPNLKDVPVLILGGKGDPLVPKAQTEALVRVLSQAGADLTVSWQPYGHALGEGDIKETQGWLEHFSTSHLNLKTSP